jgi:transcriptional regulator GlxA family with amidase domain
VRGLADERVAIAIRCVHERPAEPWTVAQLPHEAALSRSVLFRTFSRTVGVAPIEYFLAWRMALAINLLRPERTWIAHVAKHVGYSSAKKASSANNQRATGLADSGLRV